MIPLRPFLFFSTFTLLTPVSARAAAPNAPTDLTVTADGGNAVDLAWKDNSADEAGFEIQYRQGTAGNFISLGATDADEVTVHLTGTSSLKTYQFQIRALNNANPIEYSAFAGPVTLYSVSSETYHSGVVGQTFSYGVTSSSPTLATTYSVSMLPEGLSINPSTGVITGIPSTSGRITGTVTITHNDGGVASAPLDLRIFKPLPALSAPEVTVPVLRQSITLGTVPPVILLSSNFTDPDVPSAARLTTDLGVLDFAFYPGSAPQTVANFLGYLGRGDFANTMFHRSVPAFIIQGGAFLADATASKVPTQPPVKNEPDITNARGTVAMAKIGGDPDSATNQFFINLAANASNLDNQNEGFTVFARVAGNGMAVADAIAALPTMSFSTVNSALTNTPVRGTPPATYDPAALVRVISALVISPLQFTAGSMEPAIATVSVSGTDLQLIPVAAGETTVRVTATDLDSLTVQSSFAVTVNDSFESWAARQTFSQPDDAAATADPDLDGRINLTEFALASAPLSATDSDPEGSLVDGHLQLVFTLRQYMAGVTVTLQSATGLSGPWADEWKNTDGLTHPWISTSEAAEGILTITARDPAEIPLSEGARKFLRLKIDGE